jgi:hypothetical protein
MTNSNDDRRSILQVPSLTSNGIDRNAGEEKKEDDHGSCAMVPPAWRSANMPYRPGMPMMMQRQNVWNVYSPEPPQWINSPNYQDANRAVPPYSPISVRSSRGAAQVAYSRPMIHPRQHLHQQIHHLQQSPMPMSHEPSIGLVGFPVSNRGRGGPGSAGRRIITTPLKPMADRIPSSIVPASVTVTQTKHRPILKRKLPISKRQSTDETLSDTDDSCTSTESASASKRSKSETAPSESTSDKVAKQEVTAL